MNQREFEQRLRAFYGAEADAAGPVPGELWDSVWDIPDDIARRSGLASRRGMVILAAAAMLTALLLGAIAVGTGLVRLPWPPDATIDLPAGLSGEALSPMPCDQSLADGLVLSVDPNAATDWLFIYQDGLLLRVPKFEEQDWRQRRLSAEGIQRLLSAVEQSGLRDCRSVPVAGIETVDVRARTAGGVVSTTLGGGWLRVASERETEAATALAEQLLAPDMGIPEELWIESDWTLYEHERREIRIHQWIGTSVFDGDLRVTAWGDLILPDGSDLTTFGAALPEVPPDFVKPRCGVVTPEESEAIAAVLGDPMTFSKEQWAFRDPSQESGGIVVQMRWPLLHQVGCHPDPRRAPVAEPPDNQTPGLQPCDYLPADWEEFFEMPAFDDDWGACETWAGWLYVSRHPVSSEAVVAIVGNQFGIGLTTEEIAGRTVYLNACAEFTPDCAPAIAISADPLLIIIAPMPGEATGPAGDRRELAEEIIERLDD